MVLLLPDLSADFFARFAALRPSKPGLPPSTLKKRACWGAPACWEQLRASLHPTEPKTGSSGTPSLRRKVMFLFEYWTEGLRRPCSLRPFVHEVQVNRVSGFHHRCGTACCLRCSKPGTSTGQSASQVPDQARDLGRQTTGWHGSSMMT